MRTALVLILAFTTALAGKHYIIETENSGEANDDYWTEHFDTSQNCENKEEIKRLLKLTPSQCTTMAQAQEQNVFRSCKKDLEKYGATNVEDPGRLFYCKSR